MRLRTFTILASAMVMLHASNPIPSRAAESGSGWDLLWSNRLGAAEQRFRHDVTVDKNDASAWRGLGWTSYYKDDTHAALTYWSRAVELAPTAWTSAALWPTMASITSISRDFESYEAAAKVLASTSGVRPEIAWSARLVLAHQADRKASLAVGSRLYANQGLSGIGE